MRKRADRLLGCGEREIGGGRRESTAGGGANEGTRLASDARVRVPDAGSGVGEVKFARQGKKKMRRRERAGCLFHFQFSPAQEWETLGRVGLGAATLPIPAVPSQPSVCSGRLAAVPAHRWYLQVTARSRRPVLCISSPPPSKSPTMPGEELNVHSQSTTTLY
ncbi:hypothetical protein M431DRAFT_454456 [Trichoderma harzianum CBS 226.95]|uniref:Uncharacterized protein n=1 Tax=Trichoderma harzianum CBS 226.95 TaxID=983964 RepID=A0A2T4ABC1_TRIHA|nr:hypothetical protein M431DRAFT_454456 [Trichoderma harzianum CBS 226.95]PTB54303.1 hypothetical protein M431DRAFT_454456 [Trichoderma harzianum CBS 226.95]